MQVKILKSKSYITDCEGPLTLNDNAFEIAEHFLSEGGELFKILSLYDDYLVDVAKRKNYKAGNTLKLIVPFFLEEGLTNDDMVRFSSKHISTVNHSEFLVDYLKERMNFFIVSTSYTAYIKALADYIGVPFENTFYTNLNMDELTITDEEKSEIRKFKKSILEDPENYELLDDIFFKKIPEMGFYSKLKEVSVVGGEGKKIAIEDLIENRGIDKNEILYIGDSITDVEPLEFAKQNNGISISFNGNQYSLNAAEIAVVSSSAIISVIMADIFNRFNRNAVLKFIDKYNECNDINQLFDEFEIDEVLRNKFSKDDLILIELIDEENFDEILERSSEMRKEIRGKAIGALG